MWKTGNLSINHFVASTAETPFGGVKDFGDGREGGIEGLGCYTVTEKRLAQDDLGFRLTHDRIHRSERTTFEARRQLRRALRSAAASTAAVSLAVISSFIHLLRRCLPRFSTLNATLRSAEPSRSAAIKSMVAFSLKRFPAPSAFSIFLT